MTEPQKIENEITLLRGLLQKETNLVKQGELSAKIKQLTDSLNKMRPPMKNSGLKASNNTKDLKSSNICDTESQKIKKEWNELTRGNKK